MDRFPEGWLSSGVDPRKLPENTVANANRWDRQDWTRLLTELAAVSVATEEMAEFGPTGRTLMEDAWYGLFKMVPELAGAEQVRPSHLVNLQVMGEFLTLGEYTDLHRYTAGDDVAAGMALATLEPELEQLLDKNRQRQQEAEALDELMRQLADAMAEQRSMDDLVAAWSAERDDQEGEEGEGEGQGGDGDGDDQGDVLKAGAAAAAARVQELIDLVDEAGDTLCQGMAIDMPGIRRALAEAIGKAADQARQISESSRAWGVEPGQLIRMPADERLALARKLNTPRLKKIAELFGPMKQLMFTEQSRKVTFAQTEVMDIETGNDVARLLPSELLRLGDPDLEDAFYKDFVSEDLLQYRLEGDEKVGRGGIILCEDGSASMKGEAELWAKAVMLCLLHLARQQRRAFYLIHFGSKGQIYPLEFTGPEHFTTDRILAAAELFCNGGTDFEDPLNHAVERLQAEHKAKGRVEGDIVFLTDGLCGVSERWMQWFKEEQDRLKFMTWGVAISHHAGDRINKTKEPLRTICDGRVAGVKDLMDGGDIREVFRGV